MRNLVWRSWWWWGEHTHMLGMNYFSRFNVYSMETVQTFDVTANKFNVYWIPNEVKTYSHKKCADKQKNNCNRDFVAKGDRSTGKWPSWVLYRISHYFLPSCLIYFFFISRFVSNVLLGLFSFPSFFIASFLFALSFLSFFILIHVVI
jgi:hypothetical protein